MTTRRHVLQSATAAGASFLWPAPTQAEDAKALPGPIAALASMTSGAEPITAGERRARVRRAQELMAQEKLDALVVAPGTSLEYFAGVRWSGAERLLGHGVDA